MFSKKKVAKKKSTKSFFSHKIGIKIFIVLISICIFIYVLYKSYKYATEPVNIDAIPLISNEKICIKAKNDKNDGLIFSNQDKIVYDSLKKNSTTTKKKKESKKVIEDFSHQQIFDIVKDIKGIKDDVSVNPNVKKNVKPKENSVNKKLPKKAAIKKKKDVFDFAN
ncbi:MAG: hypothetical protein ACI8ZF_000986 [Candidatus Midichloriaceae bacterium]|jgi:hypothetical protein